MFERANTGETDLAQFFLGFCEIKTSTWQERTRGGRLANDYRPRTIGPSFRDMGRGVYVRTINEAPQREIAMDVLIRRQFCV